MLKQLLFKFAKAPCMGKLVGIAFQYFSWAIPVKKVYNSKDILAFYHPKPCYENHIIISPKRAINNLRQMSAEGFNDYFVKLWEVVWNICASHPEYQDSFVLVANGGKRQEVGQVHFHMFTGHEILNSDWEAHFVIPRVSSFQLTNEDFKNILHNIAVLEEESDIEQKGYSLVYRYERQKSDATPINPVFHIIAGNKRK